MKKAKNTIINILLYITIIFLITFIALPPILRKTISDVNLSNDNNTKIQASKDKNEILSCSKTDNINLYVITSKSMYVENVLKKNIITYTKIDNAITSQVDNESSSIYTPEEEIYFFSTINGISINNNDKMAVIVITKAAIDINNSNERLLEYFNEKEKQRKFYEEQGYTCEEIMN